jgi:hypothetical protein
MVNDETMGWWQEVVTLFRSSIQRSKCHRVDASADCEACHVSLCFHVCLHGHTKWHLAFCVPLPRQHIFQRTRKFSIRDWHARPRAIPSDIQAMPQFRSRGTLPHSEDIASPHVQRSNMDCAKATGTIGVSESVDRRGQCNGLKIRDVASPTRCSEVSRTDHLPAFCSRNFLKTITTTIFSSTLTIRTFSIFDSRNTRFPKSPPHTLHNGEFRPANTAHIPSFDTSDVSAICIVKLPKTIANLISILILTPHSRPSSQSAPSPRSLTAFSCSASSPKPKPQPASSCLKRPSRSSTKPKCSPWAPAHSTRRASVWRQACSPAIRS